MLMPARIITESWLVKFWMSLALGPNERLIETPFFLTAVSVPDSEMMYSPRARSCSEAAERFAALRTPETS
jgi:hypothetical protein